MKQLLLFAALFCAACAQAQDCNGYYFMQNNKTVEMTVFNRKGDPTAKQVYKVTNVESSGGITTASLSTEMFDKKGKSIGKSTGTLQCTGGALMMDMKMTLPSQQQEQFANTSVKSQNFYIEYPYGMKEGDQLKDASMDLDMENGGIKQSMTFSMSDRKVQAKEKVTTPAGSWDCFKISYKSKITIKAAGMSIPANFEGTEWYAPGFGVVKTESRHGSTMITAIQ